MTRIAAALLVTLAIFFEIASGTDIGPETEAESVAATIKVHFVPHSHMDAGWLKTYDEYYEGEVSKIFKSVFRELQNQPKYTYTLGDILFFRRYYSELQKDKERDDIK